MKRTIAIVLVLTAGIIYACTGGKSDSNSTFEESVITNSSSIDEPGITTDSDKDGNGISGVDDAPVQQEQPQRQTVSITSDKPIELTAAEFKKYIFDMDKNPKEWVYNGELPAIVDFYAVWCGPCKTELPFIKLVEQAYREKEVQFIHICMSSNQASWETLKKDIPGEHVFLTKEQGELLRSKLKINGYPTYMLIDKEGCAACFQQGNFNPFIAVPSKSPVLHVRRIPKPHTSQSGQIVWSQPLSRISTTRASRQLDLPFFRRLDKWLAGVGLINFPMIPENRDQSHFAIPQYVKFFNEVFYI